MIRKCDNCPPHAYQDGKYGIGNRVYTQGSKKEHKQCCTVCGKEHKIVIKK